VKRSRSRTHHRQICTSSAFLPWRRFWPKIEEFRSFFYVIKQKVTLYYHKHSSFATLIGTETFQQFHEQPGTLKLYLVNWEAVLPKQMAYFIVWQQCQVHKKTFHLEWHISMQCMVNGHTYMVLQLVFWRKNGTTALADSCWINLHLLNGVLKIARTLVKVQARTKSAIIIFKK
jgi:hypothetical protein